MAEGRRHRLSRAWKVTRDTAWVRGVPHQPHPQPSLGPPGSHLCRSFLDTISQSHFSSWGGIPHRSHSQSAKQLMDQNMGDLFVYAERWLLVFVRERRWLGWHICLTCHLYVFLYLQLWLPRLSGQLGFLDWI